MTNIRVCMYKLDDNTIINICAYICCVALQDRLKEASGGQDREGKK